MFCRFSAGYVNKHHNSELLFEEKHKLISLRRRVCIKYYIPSTVSSSLRINKRQSDKMPRLEHVSYIAYSTYSKTNCGRSRIAIRSSIQYV